MTDEFERLEKALQRPSPAPDPAAKATALAAAMARFEEKKAGASQGMAAPARQSSSDGIGPSAIWRKIMTALKPANLRLMPAFAGGASLAVLMLAVVSTGVIRPDLFGTDTVTVVPMDETTTETTTETGARTETETETETETGPARQRVEVEPVIEMAEEQSVATPPAASRKMAESRARPSPTPLTVAPAGEADMVADAPVANAPMAQFSVDAAGGRAAGNLVVEQEAPIAPGYRDQGRDRFEAVEQNPVKVVAEEPVSTFSIDVDTASYAFMRARLNEGVLPAPDSVRIEELINYFPYDYAAPESAETPFRANVAVMPTPWNTETRLMRIGIKGYVPPAAETPRANLVFLIDTSGSMNEPNKLPLLRNAFRLLLGALHPDDTVSIVTYAGSAGTALEPTKVADQARILAVLDNLGAGGSTAGGEGIRQAYALAEANKVDGINRVILATDGDFNVGISDTETLKDFVARKRETGVSLSVLGFGQGNYNDALMQALAQNGNGNAAYIDTLTEARKVLVEDVRATLETIAKDVKIQVEFNPAAVSEYRLIGYETRLLNREDFNNDKVDAGEIGAGHAVTALYEITPAGSDGRLVDDLRYQTEESTTANAAADELAFVKIRYKQPEADDSTLITRPVTEADAVASIDAADTEARFAAAVAAYGQILKGGRYTGAFTYDDVIALAEGARGPDRFGYRTEFVNLVRLAKSAAAMAPQRR